MSHIRSIQRRRRLAAIVPPVQWLGVIAATLSALATVDAFAAAKLSAAKEARERAAILAVVAGVNFAEDRHDGSAFASFFLPDGVLRITDARAPVLAKGTAAISEFGTGRRAPAAQGAPAPAPSPSTEPSAAHHSFTNSVIEFQDATHAKHWAYWHSFIRDKEGRGIAVLGMGSYEDTLVKVNGKWLFSEHHLHLGTIDPPR